MTGLYVDLDVSLELTNVCVFDGDGRPVHEARVGSDPETIAAELKRIGVGFIRVGLEAGALSQGDRHTGQRSSGAAAGAFDNRIARL